MSTPSPFLAHTGGRLLEAHLQKVATSAGEFAQSFDAAQWAHLAGLWHDLGKYREGFQKYLAINEDARSRSQWPNISRYQVQESIESASEFVISGSNTSKLLEPIEKSFDKVSCFVSMPIY